MSAKKLRSVSPHNRYFFQPRKRNTTIDRCRNPVSQLIQKQPRKINSFSKIEKDLNKNLCELSTKEPFTLAKFKIYQHSFEEVVQNTGSILLKSIKHAYDSFISSNLSELQNKENHIFELSKSYEKEKALSAKLSKKLKRFSLEYAKLNSKLSNLNKKESSANYSSNNYKGMKMAKALDVSRGKGVPVDDIANEEITTKNQFCLEVPSFKESRSKISVKSEFSNSRSSESIDFNELSSIRKSKIDIESKLNRKN